MISRRRGVPRTRPSAHIVATGKGTWPDGLHQPCLGVANKKHTPTTAGTSDIATKVNGDRYVLKKTVKSTASTTKRMPASRGALHERASRKATASAGNECMTNAKTCCMVGPEPSNTSSDSANNSTVSMPARMRGTHRNLDPNASPTSVSSPTNEKAAGNLWYICPAYAGPRQISGTWFQGRSDRSQVLARRTPPGRGRLGWTCVPCSVCREAVGPPDVIGV